MAAASIGDARIVEFLIDKGANAHSACGYYGNLLQTTSFLRHTEIVEVLLKNRVDVDRWENRPILPLNTDTLRCQIVELF